MSAAPKYVMPSPEALAIVEEFGGWTDTRVGAMAEALAAARADLQALAREVERPAVPHLTPAEANDHTWTTRHLMTAWETRPITREDGWTLVREVLFYRAECKRTHGKLVDAHTLLVRNGIDPVTGGPYRGQTAISTFGT